jgi:hypothetical protein
MPKLNKNKRQISYNASKCAKCEITTENHSNKKRVTTQWQFEAIKLLNSSPSNDNEFLCARCYIEINKFINNHDDFEKLLETEKEIKTEKEEHKGVGQFGDFESMTDLRCYGLTGIHKEQLEELTLKFENVKPPVKLSLKHCFFFYLMKLRLGISSYRLGLIYTEPSQYQIKQIVIFIRELLFNEFTPLYLGVHAASREKLIKNHTTTMSKILLNVGPDSLPVVMDATYIYTQKSSNYSFQKDTFSAHKKKNLLKFMIICATDGYMLAVIGPYICNGKNNDASIILDIFKNNINELENYFEMNDVFIVDRGFRDSLEYLETKGYKTQMPTFLGKRKQHTAAEANASRLVTKIRWVIESANGRIKKWSYFYNTIENLNIPFIEKDFKNICAIINAFRPPLGNVNDEENTALYKKMMIIALKRTHLLRKL